MDYSKKLTKYKVFEIEFHRFGIKNTCNYFDAQIAWTTQTDHSGFRFNVDVLGFSFNITIYDTRHWDYDMGRWCEYDT